MRSLPPAAALALALYSFAASAQEPAALPRADYFAQGSGRTWFADCNYEAERYVVCKTAAKPVLDAIADPGSDTPGTKLQMLIGDLFIEKGCAFEAAPDSFRVNGVFLSFDTKAAKTIRCGGKPSKVEFAPGMITLLDTVYFFNDDPPQ